MVVGLLSSCADDDDDQPDGGPATRRDSGADGGTCTAEVATCDDDRCDWQTARHGISECRAPGYPVSYLAHCGPYDAVVHLSGDSATRDFYDRVTGKRVGYLHTFPVWTCEAYDRAFALPSDECEPFEDTCVSDEDAGS